MRKFSLLFAVIAVAGGCAEIEEIGTELADELPKVLYASVSENGDDAGTRTYVDGKAVKWHAGESISYYAGEYGNVRYVMREGQYDGTVNAEFIQDDNGQFSYGQDGNPGHEEIPAFPLAVYPYDKNQDANYGSDRYNLHVTYPENQTYALNSFGKGANVMIASGESGTDENLFFRHACGYLVIKLYGHSARVKDITLTALGDGVKISGDALFFVEKNSEFTFDGMLNDTASNSVSLDCSNGGLGVEIGADAENATEFWFALPPVRLEGGFRITVTDVNDVEFTKQTSKTVEIERNTIQPMAAIEAVLSPNHSQIWYTQAAGVTTPIEFGTDTPFDAEIDTHEYDEARGFFIINFKSPVTRINDKAFKDKPIVTITLPDGIKTIGKSAFAGSTYNDVTITLASINIPGSVELIDADAFMYCNALRTLRFEPGPTRLKIECIHDGIYGYGPFYYTGPSEPYVLYLDREFDYIHNGEPFFPDNIEESLFAGACEVNFGPNITEISDRMFADTPLTEVTIPSNIKTVGERAFYHCIFLEKLTISSGVEEIRPNAFMSCDKLSEIIIEDSDEPLTLSSIHLNHLTKNDYGPFKDSPLKSIYLGRDINHTDGTTTFYPDERDEGIFSMSDYIRDTSTFISTVTIGPKVSHINDYMFSNLRIESITIPSTVSSVGYSAFEQCIKLKTVNIEESDQSLSIGYQLYYLGATYEYGTFYDSPLQTVSLRRELIYKDKNGNDFTPDGWEEGVFANKHDNFTSINLGGNLRNILPYMFSHSETSGVWIPHTIKSIGAKAFTNCDNLSTLTLGYDGTTVFPTIGEKVFEDCDKTVKIKVRESVYDTFIDNVDKNQFGWGAYADRIITGPYN